MEYFIAVTAVALIFIIVAYVRRGQQKSACPQCASLQIRTVDQQLRELQQDNRTGKNLEGLGGIGGFGKKLDVQLIMETRYRCLDCNHIWTVIAPES